MKYISEKDILAIGGDWRQVLESIERATFAMMENNFSQPIKQYLRFEDPKNRIIAMPAYVGSDQHIAGLKWIASFPDNIKSGGSRSNSIVILNDCETGAPYVIVNSATLSAIRTAGVSGVVMSRYLGAGWVTQNNMVSIGIIGLGRIGRMHIDMINSLFPTVVKDIFVFDCREVPMDSMHKSSKIRINLCENWEDVFEKADIFITCTVAPRRYINKRAEFPSLHINVSLRDYEAEFMNGVDLMIVDDWDEVCREGTDIEHMHRNFGLQRKNVYTIIDVVFGKLLDDSREKVVMFNPMGMAVYDISIAKYYYDLAICQNLGLDIGV